MSAPKIKANHKDCNNVNTIQMTGHGKSDNKSHCYSLGTKITGRVGFKIYKTFQQKISSKQEGNNNSRQLKSQERWN